ncbi:MAG TPA: hypothetical protein VGT78_11690 [Rhizomicrobium sp.]|nr:hypothetical protein [Rhizomicrobium sp.]
MTPFAESLARSPELFPHGLDPRTGAVGFIRLTERDYRQASFLDGRLLTPQTISRAVPWPQVEQAVAETGLPEACGFIFHIGHVGSTLLSRLLGAHPRILSLREPAILRTLAEARSTWTGDNFEARMSAFLKLWSRTFSSEQRALVKATSFVSELAADLMARNYAPKAIFMTASPQTYLATILGGPNSRQESKILAESRLARLQRRLGRNISPSLSEGEAIAMSWACEMSALNAAMTNARDRILLIDFDKFLAEPQSALQAAFSHFGIATTENEIATILSGPDMSRYSKAPEYAYDAKLRDDVLNQARTEYGGEIRRGMTWLESAAGEFAEIRGALNMS